MFIASIDCHKRWSWPKLNPHKLASCRSGSLTKLKRREGEADYGPPSVATAEDRRVAPGLCIHAFLFPVHSAILPNGGVAQPGEDI